MRYKFVLCCVFWEGPLLQRSSWPNPNLSMQSPQLKGRDTHIVYLGNVDKSLHLDAVTSSHHALLQGVFGRKLIGARFFSHGLQDGPKAYAKAHQELLSPRDVEGHRFVKNTTGLATQKCGARGSHTLSAFDMGIHNGVDIFSASIDGQQPLSIAKNVGLPTSNFSASQLCMGWSLDPEKVQGKIVACLRGPMHLAFQSFEVSQAGGAGIIFCNSTLEFDQNPENEFLLLKSWTSHLLIYQIYKLSCSGYTASDNIEKSKRAPYMAPFSSSGPNIIDPDILKPDITAPGVNILAAYTQFNNSKIAYMLASGTSMSCPHVTGIVRY
ncbi:hypothetical protein SELMODRAFT_427594 [Selaginella moellendorffii]|uniref:Peptidase S8/S53 domain-containing protein n=1 Tax=Selaginella moellendorffii TaxID=88036 RepID=D8T039_SELML|nr:hypothetical protein SELMODRAFT_427594 [Selaginella moellendorffii]